MAKGGELDIRSRTQKLQRPLQKEVDVITDWELTNMLIDNYMNLQRIKAASDKEKEVEYQIKTVKAKLEASGIVTEDLDIH